MRSAEYNRLTYLGAGLEALDPAAPAATCLELLELWWAEAVADDRVSEPSAAAFATYDATSQLPDCRILLVKDFDRLGVRFFTNYQSSKGRQLSAVPGAALTLLWHPMFRQIRLRGPVEPTTAEEDLAYWRTRPRESQIASSVSVQSQLVGSRAELIEAVQAAETRFQGAEVPLPDQWGGYRLRPVEVEFWVGMPARLHDRIRWCCEQGIPLPLDQKEGWECARLQP